MEDEINFDEYKNKCTLFYKVSSFQKNIKIFDAKFCGNNSQNCQIIINGQKQNICDYYQNINFENNITIELILNNEVTDLNYMFNGCSSLSSITFSSN